MSIKKEKRFIEPLIYRFQSNKLYYPLKTSNIVGGRGVIDLILLLPSSIIGSGDTYHTIGKSIVKNIGETRVDLSSSSKVYPEEIEKIYAGAGDFVKNNRIIYMQVLRYAGEYDFNNDLLYDLSNLRPYAYKIVDDLGRYEDNLTLDELKDYLDYLKENKVIK